jgi:hypothetical protein
MANKKHYHYDKEQFVDREGMLFFLMNTSTLDYDKLAYHMVDIFNTPQTFTSLYFFSPVTDTYKSFVDAMCEEMDFSHRSPTGFSKELRTIVIHRCLNEAYKSINKEYLPTVENLASVFNITYQAMLTADKKAQERELSCV